MNSLLSWRQANRKYTTAIAVGERMVLDQFKEVWFFVYKMFKSSHKIAVVRVKHKLMEVPICQRCEDVPPIILSLSVHTSAPRCNRTRQRPGPDNNHTIWSLSGPESLGPHNNVGKIVRSLSGPETPVFIIGSLDVAALNYFLLGLIFSEQLNFYFPSLSLS